MTERDLLPSSRLSPAASDRVRAFQADVVAEVKAAIDAHPVVVVGMAQNPHVRRARRALEAAGVAFHYIEHGSYLSGWQRRLAIKLWSGYPTFPQVFVRGVLIGGADQTQAELADGTLEKRLGAAAVEPLAATA